MQNLAGLADGPDDQQVAEVAEKIDGDLMQIDPLLDHLVHQLEDAGNVLVGDQVDRPEQQDLVDQTEQFDDGRFVDRVAGEGDELVEQALGVSQATIGGGGDQGETVR